MNLDIAGFAKLLAKLFAFLDFHLDPVHGHDQQIEKYLVASEGDCIDHLLY